MKKYGKYSSAIELIKNIPHLKAISIIIDKKNKQAKYNAPKSFNHQINAIDSMIIQLKIIKLYLI